MRSALIALLIAIPAVAQTPVFTWSGATPTDFIGASLVGPGDLNGDTVPDIVIACVNKGSGGGGPGFVVARSGVDGSILWQAPGAPGEHFGMSAARAGDVNGDGITDIIVAAREGRGVVILSGATGGVIRSMPDYVHAVDGGFDFNGDSVPDQLGCWSNDASFSGGVKIYSGVDGSVLHNILPGTFGFGGNGNVYFHAKFIADQDGDGYDDVVAARNISGVVARIRGPNGVGGGGVTYPGLFVGAINVVGKVSGDNLDDIAVFWDQLFSARWFRVHNSGTGGVVWENQIIPQVTGVVNLRGDEVARLPDLNGDGRDDFATTSVIGGGGPAGATVVSGATGTQLSTVFSPYSGVSGVSACATIGDITGDGIPEFAYGYFSAPNGGYVAVVSPVTLTSPSVVDLGGACGAFPTLLSSSVPTIGSTLSVNIANAQPSTAADLVVDLALDVPTPLNPCGTVHLDFGSYFQWTFIPLTIDGTGAAGFNYPIPTIPMLEGQVFTTQAVVFGTTSPLGFDLSNGLRGTIGF
jgi:FG-GAP-like repeat